jgi:hypothetical protein
MALNEWTYWFLSNQHVTFIINSLKLVNYILIDWKIYELYAQTVFFGTTFKKSIEFGTFIWEIPALRKNI